MYAIVKTGGKQYRVQEGQSLLIERLPVEDGAEVTLQPLLYVDGGDVVDGDGLDGVQVRAKVLAHERGPKLRIVKFKPKRGYKRRNGHRQELTRIEVTTISSKAASAAASAKAGAKQPAQAGAKQPARAGAKQPAQAGAKQPAQAGVKRPAKARTPAAAASPAPVPATAAPAPPAAEPAETSIPEATDGA